MQYPPKLQSSLSLDLNQRIAYVLKSPPKFWCDITLRTVAKEESNIKMDILLHQFRESLSAVHYNETVDEVALSTEMEDPHVKEVSWPGIDVDAALSSFAQIIQPTQSFSFISWDTVPAPVFKVLGVIFLQVYMDRDIARAIRNLTTAVLHRLQLPLTLLGLLWLAYMFECKALTESLIALCELYYMYLILCKTIRERQLKNACIILTSIVFMLVKMWSFSDFLSRLMLCASMIVAKYNETGNVISPLSGPRGVLGCLIQNPLCASFMAVMFPEACKWINLLWFSGMMVWLSINELSLTSEWNQLSFLCQRTLRRFSIFIIFISVLVII